MPDMLWKLKAAAEGVVIAPDERLPWGQTTALGLQHVVAMFGANVLGPILMGLDANVCVMMSGVGTLIFFFVTGGKVPSFVGSSFAFISVVIAATGFSGKGANPNIPVAAGGIIACGVVYAAIALAVMASGTRWIERMMPPVVTGSVVAVIVNNNAPNPVKGMAPTEFDAWMEVVTFVSIGVVAVFTTGMVRRLLIVVGLVVATIVYAILTNGLGLGKPIDGALLANAAWLGMPNFTAPVFDGHAMVLIVPVALILVAENLGHLKAVAATTGRDMDPYIGRGFLGDAIATVVAGSAVGGGTSPYPENTAWWPAPRTAPPGLSVVPAFSPALRGFPRSSARS